MKKTAREQFEEIVRDGNFEVHREERWSEVIDDAMAEYINEHVEWKNDLHGISRRVVDFNGIWLFVPPMEVEAGDRIVCYKGDGGGRKYDTLMVVK